MRRPLLLFVCAAALALVGSVGPQADAAPARSVDVVKVDGVIDGPVGDYLVDSIRDAEARGSTVVLQLDSPGTLGIDPVALANRIFEAGVPVVVWIGPTPAHAAGGGFLLVQASAYAVIAPGAGVGPVAPLDLAHRAGGPDPDAGRAASAIRRWSSVTGRPTSFPPSEEPGAEAIRLGIVQDFAATLGQLLHKLDGVRVRTASGPVTLHTDPQTEPLRFHELGPARRILHAVASPVAVYVLFVLGLAGLAFELTQAGIGVAGIAGAIAVGFAVYGLTAVPFSPIGLGLFLGGQALLAADVLLRRLDVLTAAGMAALVAGSVLVFGQVAPAIDLPVWLVVVTSIGCFLYYGFGLTVAQKSRERVLTRQRGLVGLVGEARGALAPDGPVFVKGSLWRGRAMDGPIPAGARVRVRRVEGLILGVEPEDGAEGDSEV